MGLFDKKRLLMLGTSAASVEMVKYAKSEGAYVIVTDYLPPERSAAKKYADESAMISTLDIDALCEFALLKRIDGVFCGVSEPNLLSVKEVADRLSLPCYFTKEQWDVCQNKESFKKLCQKYGVPVPTDYSDRIKKSGIENADIDYPVIVKPVDSSSGQGINVCNNKEELIKAYDYALSFSKSKNVLVEEFLSGIEVTATYTMKNGEISLSCFKDKLITEDHPDATSQAEILIAPSRFIDDYVKNVNGKVIDMLKGINATDGAVFFQGIAGEKGIKIFECGYRINGGNDYRFCEAENGINYMKMMVGHAMTGQMTGASLSQDNPFFKKYVLNFNVYVHGGVIASLSGLSQVLSIDNVITAEYLRKVGDEVKDDNTLFQRAFRAVIRDDSIDRIKDTVKKILEIVKVTDTNGNDMKYKPFNIERLNKYKNKEE